MPTKTKPLPLLAPLIARGRTALEKGVATRERHRRRRRPDRAMQLTNAIASIDLVMKDLRRWLGVFAWQTHPLELEAREISRELQTERHKLRRLLKKTRS